MCGILGVTGIIKQDIFLSALNRITHRGPDDFGVWNDEGHITLGHRRLSILDLSDQGHQPMTDDYGRYAIVFNGEIYNFLEIKNELSKKGYIFKGTSDTEVVLAAYAEWGRECQNRFNGMWSFAIWDKHLKTLFLSRDRFGKKPLYFINLPNHQLVFASEMKALYPFLENIRPSVEINKHLLYPFDYESTKDCAIEGISRLPPGFCASYRGGFMYLSRWWNTLDHLIEPPKRYEEQVELWRELFLDSVRIRMRSDVPIGTALSGGLDSSAVFSAMGHISEGKKSTFMGGRDWQNGFCSHFPGSSLDELGWARIVGESLGLPVKAVEINPMKSKWTIEQSLYQVEDPYPTLPIPMLETYRAISNSGVKVTLDGHGADELFTGYGHLLSIINSCSPKQFAEISAVVQSGETGIYAPNYKNKNYRWLEQRLRFFLQGPLRTSKALSKAILGKIDWNLRSYQLTFEDQSHPEFKRLDPLSRKLYEIFHITILPTLLRNYDRYSMASGVEVRMPFMDWRLVTYTFSLPWTSKVGEGFTKRIMRDALKGILPEPIRLRRDKIGWNAPMHEWLKGPLKDEILSTLNFRNVSPSVIHQWNRLQNNNCPDFIEGYRVWKALLPYLWRKSLINHN